jgi:ectoine hydroxylase-related dioxygenase (phytanoyl-CoA dioxygenase family)
MDHPAVACVASDPRMLLIARRFLDAEPIPFRATLFDKSPQNNWLVVWHQDTALPLRNRCDVSGWGSWSVKAGIIYAHAPAAALSRVIALRLHFDDSDAENGPLRVIPGSHALGVLSDSDVQQLVAQSQPVDCIVPTGGVLAMRPLILHASSKAESDRPRRVLHIEYADSVKMGDGLELAIA